MYIVMNKEIYSVHVVGEGQLLSAGSYLFFFCLRLTARLWHH